MQNGDGSYPIANAWTLAIEGIRIQQILSSLPKPESHAHHRQDRAARSFDAPPPLAIMGTEHWSDTGARSRKKSGKGDKSGKGSGKKGKKSREERGRTPLPKELVDAGCVAKTPSGGSFCFPYNMGGCSLAADGATCPKGAHLCARPGCAAPHCQRQHVG